MNKFIDKKVKVILISLSFFCLMINTVFSKDILIDQKDKKFSVTTVEVNVGDTLKFKNSESTLTHNVYSMTPDNSFELRVQKPGETSSVVLDKASHKPGIMEVECAIHPDMKLKVVIK